MATLKPFPALRPDPTEAKEICAPPYDVLNSEEAREMAEGNPLSFLRVSKPEIEMDPNVDPYSPEVYEHGAANLRRMIREGHLFQDDKPCYYIYKLVMGSHAQIGLVAAASCAEYDANVVKKHELTRPDKEDDRMRHIEILGAQTGPVFLTYRAVPEIDALIDSQIANKPDYDYVADDGIAHTAWVVKDDEVIRKIEEAFQRVPALYVADGHHRSAAAARIAKEHAAKNENHNGEEPYNFFLSVTFPHDQMQILGYNRVVRDLVDMNEEEFLAKLGEVMDISDPIDSPNPTKKGEITMYLGGTWRLLTWKAGVANGEDTVSTLDTALLQANVLDPLLGVRNPRTDKRIHFVGGIRGTAELERLVDSGKHTVAFALYPVSVEDLMAIADEDGLMPPKSTWFEPKLRDAMMSHML
ncbi:DUF1015 family protein [bacterium]|nr:DUF1015 family protein [bacterium]